MHNFGKIIIAFLLIFYGIYTFLLNNPRKDGSQTLRNTISNNSLTNLEKVDFRIITAFSANHFDEAIRGCVSVANLSETKNWQNGFMIAFLLNDITEDKLQIYKKTCPFVEIRKFEFQKYPKFIKNLMEYRWKPLLIQSMINEFENIFYFDSSIIFHENTEDTITHLFKAQHSNFLKCGMRLFHNSGHTIYAATHPALYKLLKFDQEIAKHHLMYGATLFTAMKSPQSTKIINNWVKCAKEKHCMAPVNAQVICDGEKLRNTEYANCHRYDQSVLSILLVQHCSKNYLHYFLETPLIEVKRL